MIGYLTLLLVLLSQMILGVFFDTNKLLIEAYAKEVQEEEIIALPVLMFHSFTTDIDKTGSITVITDKKFEEVIDTMKSRGYSSVSFIELEKYVKGEGILPEKPYIITSDDGYLDNYEIMYPILKEKKEKALISIIGERIENTRTGDIPKLSWEQINEMINSGIIEIGNHTYAMHEIGSMSKGGVIGLGENQVDYAKEFSEDVKKLNKLVYEKCGVYPKVFCYPFGYFDVLSEAVISGCGLDISLTTEGGINYIKQGCKLNLLKRYNIDMDTDTEALIDEWEKIGN